MPMRLALTMMYAAKWERRSRFASLRSRAVAFTARGLRGSVSMLILVHLSRLQAGPSVSAPTEEKVPTRNNLRVVRPCAASSPVGDGGGGGAGHDDRILGHGSGPFPGAVGQ